MAKKLNTLLGFLGRNRQIHFVYLPQKQFSGSSVMRVNQLAKIAKQYTDERSVLISPLRHDFKRSTLFLSKWAIEGLSERRLEELKNKKNKLVFDPVDAFLPAEKAHFADVIVAASRSALLDYSKMFNNKHIALVDHHVDPRIRRVDWSNRPNGLQIGYFGELVNAYHTQRIEKLVDFIQVDTNRQSNGWLDKLPSYNMHYAVRQIEQIDHYKPFLKGFTAAHCNSNIMIQSSQREAVLWLGQDYPYLLKGKVTEAKVLKMLNRIKDSYETPEWDYALEIMAAVKEKTSEPAIGAQLANLLNTL